MNISRIDPSQDMLWQNLVEQQTSTVFHSPRWIDVLNKTYDFDVSAYVLQNEPGEPKAGIAYCKIDDMMDPRIASLPFSDFCDPLVGNREEWNQLINKILAEDCRISLRCLHNDVALDDERFPLTGRAKWHCVHLQKEVDDLWMGLHSSARRAIKKAKRNGIEVQIAKDKTGLRAFFELHLRLRKYKYHLLAQPYRFFENIWDNFIATGNGALMLATLNGEVLGGVMFLEWQKKLYYKFNASNPEYISYRPNDVVVWEGMKYGQARGYEYLDFGLSDWDQEGLLRYKRKFATEEKTVSMLRHTPNGSPSKKEQQIRKLLPQLTDLFVDATVPDDVTEQAGNTLYQFFT